MFRIKFILLSCLFFIVLTGLFFNCSQEDSEVEEKMKWTFLFYDDADFEQGFDPIVDFKNSMPSGENVTVLIIRDIHATNASFTNYKINRSADDLTAAIYYVDNDSKLVLLKELGEVNMGDPETLSDFIKYGKDNFPADRYILSFYDHGGGYSGACSDDTSNDWLYMTEMRGALEVSGGVDIIMFSAPCLMGAIDAMYEVKDQTKVYIGSENLSGYAYWKEGMKKVKEVINVTPDIDTYEMGKKIVSGLNDTLAITENSYPGSSRGFTMCAARTDRMNDVISLFKSICAHYLNDQQKFNDFMDNNYDKIETYNDWNMDLISLLNQMIIYENDQNIIADLENLKVKVNEMIIQEFHGANFPDSTGLALYCPNKLERNLNSGYSDIAFSRETQWDKLLINYFTLKNVNKTKINPGKIFNYNREYTPLIRSSKKNKK